MQFTDITFLFVFLPISLLLYYISRDSLKHVILLLLSLLFYACGSREYLALLISALLVNIGVGYAIARIRGMHPAAAKICLAVGIIGNVSLLGYYKYSDSLTLPIGLSYFTFKAISYLIDVYHEKVSGVQPVAAAAYLSFFGQIQSGPIARFSTFDYGSRSYGVLKEKQCLFDRWILGCGRFMIGFSKKILLANVLNKITSEIFSATVLSTFMAWGGAICYSLQLYYDFAGYSDMAIGICGMFGLPCPENFNYPYMTKSISEFWRRWHMTLGSWFRDYVYIPMGGSRVAGAKKYRNLFVVWLLTGLWHGNGWNFIFWGMGYFILIAFEKRFLLPDKLPNRLWKSLYRIFTLLIVNFLWVIFYHQNIQDGFNYIGIMLRGVTDRVADRRMLFLLDDYKVFFLAAILFAIPVCPWIEKKLSGVRGGKAVWEIFFSLSIAIFFIFSLSLVVSGQNNPFLYMNF